MKQIKIFITTLILCATINATAQVENDKEIVVTTDRSKKEVIDLPEGMLVASDSLLKQYYAEKYLRPATDCNKPNINPNFPKEVFIDRLSRIPSSIELPYNEIVQKFIDRYAVRLRRSVSYMIGASNFYMPIFEQALEQYGLPLELKYLPIIESALDPKAVSRVGATGLWQFMITTGKQYGLEVNSLIDERSDIVKSSYAAAHYLSDLYKIFGDWNLVIAAYNAGPDNINKAIHRAKGETDYWKIYPYLPRETKGYVPAFIAANYIMNYYYEHNICPLTAELPIKTDTVIVNRDIHFEQISKVLGIDIEAVKALNPQYRRNIVSGISRPASLRLPVDLINEFIDKENDVYAYNADELFSKRREVEVTDEVVYTPSRRSTTYTRRNTKTSKRKTVKSSKAGRNVTIKNGDTLLDIAKRNGTTVQKLKKLNKISGSSITAGKKLRVK